MPETIKQADFEKEYSPTDMMSHPDVRKYIDEKGFTHKNVWTIIDGDNSDNLFACAGFHIVNAIDYIVTEKEWTHENQTAEWLNYDDVQN